MPTSEVPAAGPERFASAVRRDRTVLLVGLIVVSGIAWAQLVLMASDTTHAGACHTTLTVPGARPWSGVELATAATMWAVMMVAMMLPVVGPWVLALPRAARERSAGGSSTRAGIFLLGYGTAWAAYSIVAAVGQLALHRAALLSDGGVTTSPVLAGSLLALAGAYQLSPQREVCMTHCRSPMAFFLTRWGEGAWGAFTMGATHGLYCVGCCWALMALSFVFGVMSLAWMALITGYLVIEKTTSTGPWLSRLAGGLLLVHAAWTIARPQ
jgi:predicted metal-binding membrane protein